MKSDLITSTLKFIWTACIYNMFHVKHISFKIFFSSRYTRDFRRDICAKLNLSSSWVQSRDDSILARENWRGIRVSVSWHLPNRIPAHPRGALISVGDWNLPLRRAGYWLSPAYRSGGLPHWDKKILSGVLQAAVDKRAMKSSALWLWGSRSGSHNKSLSYTMLHWSIVMYALARQIAAVRSGTHLRDAHVTVRTQKRSWRMFHVKHFTRNLHFIPELMLLYFCSSSSYTRAFDH